MDPSMRDPSERITTSEYLKESGLLLADISSLVNHLETSRTRSDTDEIFELSDYSTPYDVPESINELVGPVHGATLHYQRHPLPSISIELHSETHTYRTTRDSETLDVSHDFLFAIPPLDPLSQHYTNRKSPDAQAHFRERFINFDQRFEEVPGISQAEFTKLLMSLAYPALPEISLDQIERLRDIDIFDPAIFEQIVSATSTSVFSHYGTMSHSFLTSDTAQLEYTYEDGRPSAFSFSCIDELNGEPLFISAQLSDKIEIKFPKKVVATGINKEAIDGLRDFALDLREIKYIRSVIQDEIATFPEAEEDEQSTPSIDPQLLAVSTNTIDVIESEIQAAADTRRHLEDFEIEDDLYHLFNPSDRPTDDSTPTQE